MGSLAGEGLLPNPLFSLCEATYKWQVLRANEGDRHTLKPNGKAFPFAMRCGAQKEDSKANWLPGRTQGYIVRLILAFAFTNGRIPQS